MRQKAYKHWATLLKIEPDGTRYLKNRQTRIGVELKVYDDDNDDDDVGGVDGSSNVVLLTITARKHSKTANQRRSHCILGRDNNSCDS